MQKNWVKRLVSFKIFLIITIVTLNSQVRYGSWYKYSTKIERNEPLNQPYMYRGRKVQLFINNKNEIYFIETEKQRWRKIYPMKR